MLSFSFQFVLLFTQRWDFNSFVKLSHTHSFQISALRSHFSPPDVSKPECAESDSDWLVFWLLKKHESLSWPFFSCLQSLGLSRRDRCDFSRYLFQWCLSGDRDILCILMQKRFAYSIFFTWSSEILILQMGTESCHKYISRNYDA